MRTHSYTHRTQTERLAPGPCECGGSGRPALCLAGLRWAPALRVAGCGGAAQRALRGRAPPVGPWDAGQDPVTRPARLAPCRGPFVRSERLPRAGSSPACGRAGPDPFQAGRVLLEATGGAVGADAGRRARSPQSRRPAACVQGPAPEQGQEPGKGGGTFQPPQPRARRPTQVSLFRNVTRNVCTHAVTPRPCASVKTHCLGKYGVTRAVFS